MPLTLVKEDGTGRSDANAYASLLDGDAYHDGHLYATAWTAASNANKEKALVFATRLIDSQYQFNGTRSKSTQALQWPREDCRDPDADGWNGGTVASNAVPKAVVEATCEMARELLIADRSAAPTGEGIIATWTDTGGTKYAFPEDKRPIISHVTQAMLTKFGTLIKRKGGAVKLVRA
jgi:hypothetical protein